MRPEDAEEYTQALGQVVAGGWRQIALGQRLGVPKALNLSTEEWVKQRLGGYVKLGIQDRQQAVIELVAEGLPNTEVAAVLGVAEATIRNDRRDSQNCESAEPVTEDPAGQTIDREQSSSQNCEPPTSEQWADLADARARAHQIEQLRTEQPERFAADEIFETLAYAVEQSEIWANNLNVSEWPGTKTAAEWIHLSQRLGTVTDLVRRLHEGKTQTYAEQ